jgi:hypothetical protein
VIDGEIRARRIKLEEGGKLNGKVQTGEVNMPATKSAKAGPVAYPQAQPPRQMPTSNVG